MADQIHFSRKPYTVTYMQDGVQKIIRRRPPPVLHQMLPTDVVKLTQGKNSDFQEGDEFKIKHINPRHPNTIQLEDGDGRTTFVPYYDLNLEEAVASRSGESTSVDAPQQNRYLLWP